MQKRAARLDALLMAERERELQARTARSQAESRKAQRELRASLKEIERLKRRQERRAERQARERGTDWAARAPLMNAVVAALGEAGGAYYELRAAFAELERQGKPAPLMLVVAQRFVEALKAQLAAGGQYPVASQPPTEQATHEVPPQAAPDGETAEAQAEVAG